MAPDNQTVDRQDHVVNRKLRTVETFRERLRHSHLLQNIIDSTPKGIRFHTIRCLALGSPTTSRSALYQLALLAELLEVYAAEYVSLYDPVFDENDTALFRAMGYHPESACKTLPETCLFFLPHADHDLTEHLITTVQPTWLLANHIVQHTERMPRKSLHEKFPALSHVVRVVEQSGKIVAMDKQLNGKVNVEVSSECVDHSDNDGCVKSGGTDEGESSNGSDEAGNMDGSDEARKSNGSDEGRRSGASDDCENMNESGECQSKASQESLVEKMRVTRLEDKEIAGNITGAPQKPLHTKSVGHPSTQTSDGFTTFSSRRKRNRKTTRLAALALDFDFELMYFDHATVVPVEDGKLDNDWGNAFSSLALHRIDRSRT